jgi:DNA-binding GntR family transcriptional regulator
MAMTRNDEMMRVLDNINARIKFFRWIDMDARRAATQGEHRDILAAIRAREPGLAADRMGQHIAVRLDQITSAIKEGYSRIYLSGDDEKLPLSVIGSDNNKGGRNG